MTVNARKDTLCKKIAVISMMVLLFLSIFAMAAIKSFADTYYTLRINYYYADGTPAHDPYIATYPEHADVDITVQNPDIDGFAPMTAVEDGDSALNTVFQSADLTASESVDVYYVAGLTHYRARYYKQNIYDDLYTPDTSLGSEYTDRYGETGTNPTDLENVQFEGFTNLFHEPDAIAADGSTLFRVYYDRNYYTVRFDLGSGGYGVEPVYAKYGTVYHIAEPSRTGYQFIGWAETDADSSEGEEGVDWHYIDENGNTITEAQALTNARDTTFTEGTVPAKDVFYKAMWDPDTTSFSVVYWIENHDSELNYTVDDFKDDQGNFLSEEAFETKISANYSVLATKDVYTMEQGSDMLPITSGMTVSSDTVIRNNARKAYREGVTGADNLGGDRVALKNLFKFNLGYADPDNPLNEDVDPNDPNYDPDAPVYKWDKDGVIIDFNDISKGTSEDLKGHEDFFQMNESGNLLYEGDESNAEYQKYLKYYCTDSATTVAGDGTTRLNIFYKRKPITMKFYYAREGLTDGEPNGKISLTNSTKGFSKTEFSGTSYQQALAMEGGDSAWQNEAADTLPQLNPKYTDPQSPDYIPGLVTLYEDYNCTKGKYQGNFRYYYYEMKSKFNAPLKGKWLVDSVTEVHKKGKAATEMCVPGSIAVERFTKYYSDHTGVNNFTIKGFYEKLGEDLMYTAGNRDISKKHDYTELHYLISWTNTSPSNNWNGSFARVLHFRYENYVELLPKEVELIESNPDHSVGITALTTGNNAPYTDVRTFEPQQGVTKWYGLKPELTVETIDSGDQYDRNKSLETRNLNIRTNQTPSDITGYEIENYSLYRGDGLDDEAGIDKKYKGQIKLNDSNTEIDWTGDSNSYRRATIKYFYRRREYTLSYRNGNCLDENHVYTVKYGAPLNSQYLVTEGNHQAGDYRYYWPEPEYYIEALRGYYNFAGWYADPRHMIPVELDTFTMPADDDVLYAKWTPKTLDVIFYDNYNDFYKDENRIGDRSFGEDGVVGKKAYAFYSGGDKAVYEDDDLQTPVNGKITVTVGIEQSLSRDVNPGWRVEYWGGEESGEAKLVKTEDTEVKSLGEDYFEGAEKTFCIYTAEIPADSTGYKVHNGYDATTVDYGSYIPHNLIPANTHDGKRPELTPPSEGASFAGWYYIDNRIPKRFEPENIPVTALNSEAAEGGVFRLYAEWVTKDVAKYKISYVEAGTGIEVAPPEIGRAFVTKTKTFTAKSGDELNDDHKWTAEGADTGVNWWPTSTSHSLLIKKNADGQEFAPNEHTFEYIQKAKVHYKVQYLDATTRYPLHDEEIFESTAASVKVDSLFIPNYVAQKASETLVLTASTASTADAQTEEELATNVITFLYDKNKTDYLYEVEYYFQDIDSSTYSLYTSEALTVPINTSGDTTVSVANLYLRPLPQRFVSNGYGRVAGATKVETDDGTTVTETPVADDGYVVVTGGARTTVKIYFNRNLYPYSYQYIDYTQDRIYREKVDNGESVVGVWDGVIQDFPNYAYEQVGKEITINVPDSLTYEGTPYTRMADTTITVTIEPVTETNPTVNLVKVYYKKDIERELQYKLVCVNDNADTDYEDPITRKVPLFGGLSSTMQTVDEYDSINNVVFYNYNEATKTVGGHQEHLHLHRYTFLGWYSTDTYDPDHPETGRLTTNITLTKEDTGNDLPATNTTYYALVKQDMVKCDIDLVYMDTDIRTVNSNSAAEALVRDAEQNALDNDGEVVGRYAKFTNPSGYVNHAETPWHRTDGYSMSMTPIDDRIYKYEFAEWWEIDSDGTYIRKDNWNSSGEWSADSVSNQVVETEDKHFIAVYVRSAPKTELNCELTYRFKTRMNGDKDFIVKKTLTGSELTSAIVEDNKAYLLTDEFVMGKAPYESNYGETLSWSDAKIEKTSSTNGNKLTAALVADQEVKTVRANYRVNPDAQQQTVEADYGDSRKINDDMKEIVADETYNGLSFRYWEVRKTNKSTDPVVAKSYDREFDLCLMDNYFLTPVYDVAASGPGTKSAVLDPSAIAEGNEQWLAWTWTTQEDGEWVSPDSNMRFSGLTDNVIFVRFDKDIAPSAVTWSGNTIWNQTDNLSMTGFNGEDFDGHAFILTGYNEYQKMVGYWSADPAPAADSDNPAAAAPSIVLTHLDYTRNRWTDEEGNIVATGETDLLFTDFEIAFEDNGNTIRNNSNYQTGVVFELCAKVPDGTTFVQGKDYKAVTDFSTLGQAVLNHLDGQNVTSYAYKSGKSRNIQFSDIPTDELTNKDRIEFAKVYRNAYKLVNEETQYTNSTYLLKATAYMVKDGTVTFSNSVYTCLKGVAAQDYAIPAATDSDGD